MEEGKIMKKEPSKHDWNSLESIKRRKKIIRAINLTEQLVRDEYESGKIKVNDLLECKKLVDEARKSEREELKKVLDEMFISAIDVTHDRTKLSIDEIRGRNQCLKELRRRLNL
jgi:hypothetical protein